MYVNGRNFLNFSKQLSPKSARLKLNENKINQACLLKSTQYVKESLEENNASVTNLLIGNFRMDQDNLKSSNSSGQFTAATNTNTWRNILLMKMNRVCSSSIMLRGMVIWRTSIDSQIFWLISSIYLRDLWSNSRLICMMTSCLLKSKLNSRICRQLASSNWWYLC